MAHFCTLISQNWPSNTPNMTGCANLSSFRDFARVLTFCLQSCVGRAMSAQKKSLRFAKISKISYVEYLAIFLSSEWYYLYKNGLTRKKTNPSTGPLFLLLHCHRSFPKLQGCTPHLHGWHHPSCSQQSSSPSPQLQGWNVQILKVSFVRENMN